MKKAIGAALVLALLLAGCRGGEMAGDDGSSAEPSAGSESAAHSEPESSEDPSAASEPEESAEDSSQPDEPESESVSESSASSADETEYRHAVESPISQSMAPETPSSSASSSSAPSSSAPASSAPPSAPPTTDGGTTMNGSDTATNGNAADSGYLASVEQQIIALINTERVSLGLDALVYDASLTGAARIRSKEMYDYDYFAHARPDGRSWDTVLRVDVPLSYSGAGENIANTEHNYKDRDPAKDAHHWYNMWRNSPGHYANMVHPQFTNIGVGIYHIQVGDMTYAYATTLFCVY